MVSMLRVGGTPTKPCRVQVAGVAALLSQMVSMFRGARAGSAVAVGGSGTGCRSGSVLPEGGGDSAAVVSLEVGALVGSGSLADITPGGAADDAAVIGEGEGGAGSTATDAPHPMVARQSRGRLGAAKPESKRLQRVHPRLWSTQQIQYP